MATSTLSLVCVVFAAASAFAVQAPTFKLSDGKEMPAIALGTWLGLSSDGRIAPGVDEVQKSVQWAIAAGYRHIDTAFIYGIEAQVGRGLAAKLADGTVTREQLFITTKLWNDKHAKDAVVPALRQSLKDLQLDYVDLYLIHWPIGDFDYVETWQGMVAAKRLGLAKNIGLSNFNQQQIDRVLNSSEVKPAALQVELNLNLQQPALRAYCKSHGIVVMGYTPFGSLFPSKAAPAAPAPRVDSPEIVAIAAKYNKTVPQVNLRYLYELDVVALPKSSRKERIEQNIDIFDFKLSEEDRRVLSSFDKHYRTIRGDQWRAHPYYAFEKTEKA